MSIFNFISADLLLSAWLEKREKEIWNDVIHETREAAAAA